MSIGHCSWLLPTAFCFLFTDYRGSSGARGSLDTDVVELTRFGPNPRPRPSGLKGVFEWEVGKEPPL